MRPVRGWRSARATALVAWVASAGGCAEEPIPLRLLTDDPVVMGISLSVVEDGPHALDLAPLPADRPRAEVLPLDTVELDALVADVDGPLALEDAAWVLCGDGCLPSMARQGERYGTLEACTEGSAATAFACLAGRGVRPRVVLPAFAPLPPELSFVELEGALRLDRVAVIAGTPGGPTTDACVQQLLTGPRTDLRGCAIGVRQLPYGPFWAMQALLAALDPTYDPSVQLPPLVTRLLPPNAAPRIEAVRLGAREDFEHGQPDEHLEARSVHEPIEVEAGMELMIEPVIEPRDRQLMLLPSGPESWTGRYEIVAFETWADVPVWIDAPTSRFEQLPLRAPEAEGPVRVYVVALDQRNGLSWFVLDLQVVSR